MISDGRNWGRFVEKNWEDMPSFRVMPVDSS